MIKAEGVLPRKDAPAPLPPIPDLPKRKEDSGINPETTTQGGVSTSSLLSDCDILAQRFRFDIRVVVGIGL